MKRLLVTALTILTMISLLIPYAGVVSAAPTIPPSPEPLPGGSLDPLTIPKYVDPLPIPGVMPMSGTVEGGAVDYYEIAATQFQQLVLSTGTPGIVNGTPVTSPLTKVWGYGPAGAGRYPGYTIEAKYNRPVRVKWVNGLVDTAGNFLSHLLPVDQTLHWANPPGPIDSHGMNPDPYTGPVPIITHLHGSHVTEESDGHPEAWYLPAANNLAGFYARGTEWAQISGVADEAGAATFQYRNDQRATTLWYHDHALGMTRTNVYAGLAGFYLLRGGPSDLPASALPSGKYEIPMLIQDRSFNADGSLFYPGDRAFFEGLTPEQLQIPFIPDKTLAGADSDVSPIWNPEFFGNTMVVNGKTWPFQQVEQKRYRFRFLNGSDSRFLILKLSNGMPFWQIGADGGFLPAPVSLNELLIAPAERTDVIIDFTSVPANTNIILQNLGPDEPFGGGAAGVDFAASNPDTTGQVIQFKVVKGKGKDNSTSPAELVLPAITPLGEPDGTLQVSLNELDSATVFVRKGEGGSIIESRSGAPFGPMMAKLGTVAFDAKGNPVGVPLAWDDAITENPALYSTKVWEIHNFTADAHPIHIHLVQFEVIERIDANGVSRGPEAWETGTKDTVISYPGEITRVKAYFDIAGLYIWHCHILSHEDHEMMRPFSVQ